MRMTSIRGLNLAILFRPLPLQCFNLVPTQPLPIRPFGSPCPSLPLPFRAFCSAPFPFSHTLFACYFPSPLLFLLSVILYIFLPVPNPPSRPPLCYRTKTSVILYSPPCRFPPTHIHITPCSTHIYTYPEYVFVLSHYGD